MRGVAEGFGAGVWSFSAGSALVSDFGEAAGFELPPPPDTSAGTLTARSVGRSIFESKRSRCPPAESGRYSDSRSSNFVLMRCSRQIWRTDNRVYEKLGMHRTLVNTTTTRLPVLEVRITGMSPMHSALAMVPFAARNRSPHGRTLIKCSRLLVMLPVQPESMRRSTHTCGTAR